MAYSFVSEDPVVLGNPTKLSFHRILFQNTQWVKDVVLGDNNEASDATPHNHSGSPLGVAVAHSDTSGRTTDDHHAQLHAAAHVAGDLIRSADQTQDGLMSLEAYTVVRNTRSDVAANVTLTTSGDWYPISGEIFFNIGVEVYAAVKASGTITVDELNDGRSQKVIVTTTESQNITFLTIITGAPHILNFKESGGVIKVKSNINGTVIYALTKNVGSDGISSVL